MQHIDISDLFSDASGYIGTKVTVCGWVRTSAEVKPMTFIQINDGTTTTKNLQLTIHQENYPNERYKQEIKPLLNLGVSLKASGTLVSSERNIIELEVDSIEMLGDCPITYPLQKKKRVISYLVESQGLFVLYYTYGEPKRAGRHQSSCSFLLRNS